MNNLINVYMDYLTKTLVNVTFACFEDNKFIKTTIEKFIRTYIDNRYNHIFHTVDDNSTYSMEVLQQEFDGLLVELLEDYKDYELVDSNNQYTKNIEMIKQLKNFAFDLIKIDDLKFRADYYHEINNIFRPYNVNIRTINRIMKRFIDRSNKFLELDDRYFSIKYDKISNVDNCLMVNIKYEIDLLNSYRWFLIDEVFGDDRLGIDKYKVILQKFSLYLLNNLFRNKELENNYFMMLDESFVVRKNINKDIETILDNPILRNYLILVVPFDVLKENRDIIDALGYRICVNLDLGHINDITTKLDNAVNMKYDYILISGYKDKDYEYIKNYKTLDEKSLLIYEEGE